jgi:signal transduction histidine kinase
LRGQDLAWLLLFSALALVSPQPTAAEITILAGLAVVQVAAPRFLALETQTARITLLALKLGLGFMLIGVTGGILSSYYPILLLPVVSAATTLGGRWTALVTLLAAAAYLVFVPIAAGFGYPLLQDTLREVALRVLFLPLVAFLTFQMAEESREQAHRAQRNADDLATANRRLREAEETVRRTERLAALGQLTAGLAHELRNPLGTIRASAEMLGKRASVDDEIAGELAGYITAEVERANLLVTRFLDFARPLSLKKASSDINAMVDRAVEAVARENRGRGDRIHKNLDPAVVLIHADPDLLERVLVNLIVNALEASPPDATVTVKTRQAGGAVEITVLDRGLGVAADLREQIFNPFFTTKATGVGLGLAISARIVGEHGGTIRVDSEPGRGAAFTVSLPAGNP